MEKRALDNSEKTLADLDDGLRRKSLKKKWLESVFLTFQRLSW